MEDCKEKLRDMLVPSLPALLFTSSAILCTYGYHLRSPAETAAGIAILFIAVALTPFAIHCSIPAPVIFNTRKASVIHRAAKRVTGNCTFVRIINPHHLAASFACCLFFLAMAWRIAVSVPDINCGNPPISSEKMVDSVKQGHYSARIYLSNTTSGQDHPCFRSLAIVNGITQLSKGDRIEVKGIPIIITPESVSTNPFHRSLFREGVAALYYLDREDIHIVRSRDPAVKDLVRRSLGSALQRLFPVGISSLLKSIYFGNKNHLDVRTVLKFKRAGVMHVLAASGLHVGIVAGIPFLLLAVFFINRKIVLFISLVVAASYLYITDLPVSLVRAFTMFAVFSILYISNQRNNVFNSLFISAIVILFIFPHEMYSMGFQLSFGATAGILLFYTRYRSILNKLPVFIRGSLALTLSAQVFVYPLILLHVGEINLVGMVSNLFVIPAITVVLISSIPALLFSAIAVDIGRVFVWITTLSFKAAIVFVDSMSRINGHFSGLDPSPLLFVPLLLLIVPLLPVYRLRPFRMPVLLLSFISASLILNSLQPGDPVLIRYRSNNSTAVIYGEKNNGILYGAVNSYTDLDRILRLARKHRIDTARLFLCPPTDSGIRHSCLLARKIPLMECTIDSRYRLSWHFSRLIKILELDNIKLHIKKLYPVVSLIMLEPSHAVMMCRSLLEAADTPNCISRTSLPFPHIIRRLFTPNTNHGKISFRLIDINMINQ